MSHAVDVKSCLESQMQNCENSNSNTNLKVLKRTSSRTLVIAINISGKSDNPMWPFLAVTTQHVHTVGKSAGVIVIWYISVRFLFAVLINEACNRKSRAQHGYRQNFVQRCEKFSTNHHILQLLFSITKLTLIFSFLCQLDSSLAWQQCQPARNHSRVEFIPPFPWISPRNLQQRPRHECFSFITPGITKISRVKWFEFSCLITEGSNLQHLLPASME